MAAAIAVLSMVSCAECYEVDVLVVGGGASGISAGVGYEADGHKAVSLGFPIEVLHNEEDIYKIINITLEFFKK